MIKIVLIAALSIFCFPKNFAQTVTTLAGSTQGYVDATGTAAKFYGIYGIDVDASGAIYVTDRNNNKIRKITSTGVVTTLAGSTLGYTDGIGTSAQFTNPNGICVDASGTLFTTEGLRIRKIITETAVVSTLAGSTQGYVDGVGTVARFNVPAGISQDSSGNLFVADTYNNAIRKITQDGVVSTLAGSISNGYVDATGTAARFYYPYGIVVDDSGTVYVSDSYNNKIRKITPNGVVTTLAGSTQGFADGTGADAKFDRPSGLCIDPTGNLYVADFNNNRIRKITPEGVVSTFAGSNAGSVNGPIAAATFNNPLDVCIDTSGTIYVADFGNNRIRKITQTLDVADQTQNVTVTIYPIPSANTINVKASVLLLGSHYSIRDQTGRSVLTGKLNDENTTISIENLSVGTYIFSTEGQHDIHSKIVKN